jgi:serine/threonine protein kinase
MAAQIIANFRQSAFLTQKFHEANPDAGAGESRIFIEITSNERLKVTALPRKALTAMSCVLLGMGIFSANQIGCGHFCEVYSLLDEQGRSTSRAVKVSKTSSSLDSIKNGQAGTEAYALFLGEMHARTGEKSPFMRLPAFWPTLLAVAVGGDQYVSCLFMEEALRTVQADVRKLASEIHTSTGGFSLTVLKDAGQLLQSILEVLGRMHELGIAHRDVKPENILVNKDGNKVIADAGLAVFPTSLHIPKPSRDSSLKTPVMPHRHPLGTGRAAAVLQAALGKVVQHSPPANDFPREVVHIRPEELRQIFSQQFRIRDNAGTPAYTAPEFPYDRNLGTMTSNDFLPGDMWAVGWIWLQILSGYKAEWIQDSDKKRSLATSSPQEFWTTYLHLAGQPSTDPAVLCAIDLARGLLQAEPANRLTCSAALAHPFLLSLE